MYRTGFGDCFLLSFGPLRSAKHVLIDFGAHMHGEIGTMDAIMSDIEDVTKTKIALIVATHAHRDHISGFGKFADRFGKFAIGEVWMPWTDDPKDAAARKLRRKQSALADRLQLHLQLAADGGKKDRYYDQAMAALSNLRGNGPSTSALAKGFDTSAAVNYFAAGDHAGSAGGIAGLSADILGPSRDKSFLSRMNPPPQQRYLTTASDDIAIVRPFPRYEIAGPAVALVLDQPIVPPNELKDLLDVARAPAGRLALVLDSARNNSSLVILFRYKGKTLLFPGDAQWGNWQSWIEGDDAADLLGDVDFFKVAHHGSDNATPVDVVGKLKEKDLAVMVSTQILPYPTIPRMPLIEALEKRSKGNVVVRSDWIPWNDKRVPEAPPKPKLPRGFKAGKVWIDYAL
jgi:hypothetical protein